MKERPPQETSIGVFIWKGIHTKWDCENSSTDPSLSINLDYKEIEPSHIERINSILESRDTYLVDPEKPSFKRRGVNGRKFEEFR